MYTCLLFCDLRNYWIRRNAKQELQNDRIPNLFSLYLLLQLALTYIEEMIFISMCRIQQRKIENPMCLGALISALPTWSPWG